MKTDRIGVEYESILFCRIQSRSDITRIRMLIRIFETSEMVRIQTVVGVEANIFKSDNMCLHIVFYEEKQFINQSHKSAIQHEIITTNPPRDGNGANSDRVESLCTEPETQNRNPKPYRTPIRVIICPQNQTRGYPKPVWYGNILREKKTFYKHMHDIYTYSHV